MSTTDGYHGIPSTAASAHGTTSETLLSTIGVGVDDSDYAANLIGTKYHISYPDRQSMEPFYVRGKPSTHPFKETNSTSSNVHDDSGAAAASSSQQLPVRMTVSKAEIEGRGSQCTKVLWIGMQPTAAKDYSNKGAGPKGSNKAVKGKKKETVVPHDQFATKVVVLYTERLQAQCKFYALHHDKEDMYEAFSIANDRVFYFKEYYQYGAAQTSATKRKTLINDAVKNAACNIKTLAPPKNLNIGKANNDFKLAYAPDVPFQINLANHLALHWAAYKSSGNSALLKGLKEILENTDPDLANRSTFGTQGLYRFFAKDEPFTMEDAELFKVEIKHIYPECCELDSDLIIHCRIIIHSKADIFLAYSNTLLFLEFVHDRANKFDADDTGREALVRSVIDDLKLVNKTSAALPTAMPGGDLDIGMLNELAKSTHLTLRELKEYINRFNKALSDSHGAVIERDASIEELMEKLAVTVDLGAFKATAQQVMNVHAAAQVHCNDGVGKMVGKLISVYDQLFSRQGSASSGVN